VEFALVLEATDDVGAIPMSSRSCVPLDSPGASADAGDSGSQPSTLAWEIESCIGDVCEQLAYDSRVRVVAGRD